MNVFDASALLAFLRGEPGADEVESALLDGGACSVANWTEVAQTILAHGRNWPMSRSLILTYPVRIESVTIADAEVAAQTWQEYPSLSLGDRLCLALADRLNATVWTADRAWGESERIRQIR